MTEEATLTSCVRCGRPLHASRSISACYGPTCRAKLAEVIEAARHLIEPERLAKALMAIEDGAVVRVDRDTYLVTSSRGDVHYEVDLPARRCTCLAARNGRRCYHVAAAAIIAATL